MPPLAPCGDPPRRLTNNCPCPTVTHHPNPADPLARLPFLLSNRPLPRPADSHQNIHLPR